MTAAIVRPGRVVRPDNLWRTALRLTRTQLLLLVREPMVPVGLIGFPAVTVLVLAGVFGTAPDPDFGGVAPDSYYVAGYIGVVIAAMGIITLPVHIATQRELGVLRRFRASGLSAEVMVISQIAVGIVLGTIASAVVLLVGASVYGMSMPVSPLGVIGWYALGLACFIAVGGALGSRINTSRSANAVGNLVFVPMFLLGGGGPPRGVMTGFMRTMSDVLPLSHIIGGIRQSWLGATDDPHVVWWPILVGLIAIAASVRAERRQAT